MASDAWAGYKAEPFWQKITANPLLDSFAAAQALAPKGDLPRATGGWTAGLA